MAFAVTGAVNVPLNDRLANAGDPDRVGHLAEVRAAFENKWVAWNHVRALLHTAAFAALVWALVVHGAHRPHESSSTGTSPHTLAPPLHDGHPQPGGHPKDGQPLDASTDR